MRGPFQDSRARSGPWGTLLESHDGAFKVTNS